MTECPCTNISIMQLFHELKQKFPLIPDRVVNECIKKNGHDKGVCETVLERENRSYLLHSYPSALLGGGTAAMSSEAVGEGDAQEAAQFVRFQHGRQSLDSITRKNAPRKSVTFRSVASDEQLHRHSCVGEVSCAEAAATSHCSAAGNGCLSCSGNRCCDQVPSRVRSADLELNLESASAVASCTCKRTSVSVVSSYAERPFSSRSAPVTPCGCGPPPFPPLTVDVTARKHRTALSVEPTAPFVRFGRNADCSRPFTRVNLVLRTPSVDPQPPIDIGSTAGGGLTYSSCSYDPRHGFQSRLQISIGPGGRGGCVSAARTRPPAFPSASRLRSATSMPDVATTSALLHMPSELPSLNPDKQALVSKQLEQKQRLEKELQREKEKLRFMQKEIELMERRLNGTTTAMTTSCAIHSRSSKVQELRDEILRLREECKRMTTEVDQSNVPLGETSEEFYRHIYSEQRSCPASIPIPPTSSHNGADNLQRLGSLDMSSAEQRGASAGDGPSWTCHVCTFRNHPLLKQCEQCDMPRINLGVIGGTQNIHIHVTHHNFPSRREAHSWVV